MYRSALKTVEKALARTLPGSLFFAAQDRLRPALDPRTTAKGRTVTKLDHGYEVRWDDGTSFCFPHKLRYCRYMFPDGLRHPVEELLRKYQDGPVQIERGDILFEIGANVGEFTLGALQHGAIVFAAEPDEFAARCLKRNVREANVVDYAIGNFDGCAKFNLATAGADSSMVNPSGTTVEVSMVTLPTWMATVGVDQIDFLKVEAEGFEPEILEGAKPVLDQIRKIAIDCGPERHGEPTFEQCEAILRDRFRLWRREWVLFGVANQQQASPRRGSRR